jgi:hypothetical protein
VTRSMTKSSACSNVYHLFVAAQFEAKMWVPMRDVKKGTDPIGPLITFFKLNRTATLLFLSAAVQRGAARYAQNVVLSSGSLFSIVR